MTPYQFKDLLKRVLKVELTIPELSSLVGHFDSDGDGTISGSEFLSAFFTLRRDEQKKVIQANQREERRQKEFMEGLKFTMWHPFPTSAEVTQLFVYFDRAERRAALLDPNLDLDDVDPRTTSAGDRMISWSDWRLGWRQFDEE